MDRIFQYSSNIQEIPRIREDLEFLQKEWGISKSEIRQILVIIEEIFSNIVRYAFEDNKLHAIDIKLSLSDGQIEIEIVDDGVEFNPLNYQLESLTDPAASDTGGMGLTLIKAFSSRMSYERISDKNHLCISKSIKSK